MSGSRKSRAGMLVVSAMMLAVLMVGLAAPARAAARANPASQQLCRKGGWEYWMRDDQTPFTSQGDCVSHAARGGMLAVPLPDLVPQVTCALRPSRDLTCHFAVRNIGLGPVTADQSFQVDLAWTSSSGGSSSSVVLESPLGSGAVFADAASIEIGSLTVGIDYLITATVDTNHQIAESNEANNRFSHTFTLVPLLPLD